jgi:hypothetical protein
VSQRSSIGTGPATNQALARHSVTTIK